MWKLYGELPGRVVLVTRIMSYLAFYLYPYLLLSDLLVTMNNLQVVLNERRWDFSLPVVGGLLARCLHNHNTDILPVTQLTLIYTVGGKDISTTPSER